MACTKVCVCVCVEQFYEEGGAVPEEPLIGKEWVQGLKADRCQSYCWFFTQHSVLHSLETAQFCGEQSGMAELVSVLQLSRCRQVDLTCHVHVVMVEFRQCLEVLVSFPKMPALVKCFSALCFHSV